MHTIKQLERKALLTQYQMFNIKLLSMPCCLQAQLVTTNVHCGVVTLVVSMQLNRADTLSCLCTNADTLTL